MSPGDHIPGLGVPLQDREVRQLLVRRRNGDGATAVDGGLVNVGKHRFRQLGEGGRRGDLNEGIHTLSHVRHRDGAIFLGSLGADDLPIPQNIEHRTREGIVGIVQLHELDSDLAVILEDESHIGLSIPHKGLPDLGGVRAEAIILRRSDLLRHIASDGHGVPGHVGEVAALAGHEGAGEVIVYAGDFDDSPGQTLRRVVSVHFADTALSGDGRAVPESNRNRVAAIIGKGNILRGRTVDLISARGRCGLSHGIRTRAQPFQPIGSIGPRDNILRKGAVLGLHMETGPGKNLARVGGVDFFDNQGIFFLFNVLDDQITENDLLHRTGWVRRASRTGKGVFIDLTLAPNSLVSQIKDKLGSIPEGAITLLFVDTGVMGPLKGIVYRHEFLGAGHHGITDTALLIPPNTCLDPGVHVPTVLRPPHIVHTRGLCFIGKYALGVTVVVSHHGFHRGVGDGGLMPPALSLERSPHSAALRAAEAGGDLIPIGKVHFVERAAPQGRRLIRHAGVSELLQRDRIRRREGGGREQPENTDQGQQHGRQTRSQRFLLH